MTTKRNLALLSIVGLAALLLVAGDVQAQKVRTPFTGYQESYEPFLPPERVWFTGLDDPDPEAKVQIHIRGMVNYNVFWADDPRMDMTGYIKNHVSHYIFTNLYDNKRIR